MQDINDIILVRFNLGGSAELDWERIQQDPVWEHTARDYDLSTKAGFEQALQAYVAKYLSQEELLTNAPMTNGPAPVFGIGVEVVKQCLAQ